MRDDIFDLGAALHAEAAGRVEELHRQLVERFGERAAWELWHRPKPRRPKRQHHPEIDQAIWRAVANAEPRSKRQAANAAAAGMGGRDYGWRRYKQLRAKWQRRQCKLNAAMAGLLAELRAAVGMDN